MKTERQLRERIMRRVWGVYIMRRISSPALRLACMGIIAFTLVSSVSMKHIIDNALSTSGPLGLARFSLSAVIDTSVFVQVLLVLAAVFVAFFIRDTIQNLAFNRAMRHAGT